MKRHFFCLLLFPIVSSCRAAAFLLLNNNVFLSSQRNTAWFSTTITTQQIRSFSLNPLYASQSTSLSTSTVSRFPYLRWKSSSSSLPTTTTTTTDDDRDASSISLWEMQTAVTTFERRRRDYKDDNTTSATTRTERVELHAQLHFGDTQYFDYYKTLEFNTNRTILYELLVDEHLLMYKYHNDNNNDSEDDINTSHHQPRQQRQQFQHRVLRPPNSNNNLPIISSSIQDETTARQYGFEACQVNALAVSCYSNMSNWIHADLTRQEFLNLLDSSANEVPTTSTSSGIEKQQQPKQQQQQPLWQVVAASSQNNNLLQRLLPWRRNEAATEAATALLMGPPIILSSSLSLVPPRRLFSNLFLSGTGLVQVLRALLWLMVPSPEISILLLDWSSIVVNVDNNNNDNYKNNYNNDDSSSSSSVRGRGGLSPITWPLLQALGRGRLDQVRRLIFGQVVLMGATQSSSSSATTTSDSWTLLIQQRNNHAMQVLRETLRNDEDDDDDKGDNGMKNTKVLLYGCSHCTDLHDQIIKERFLPVKKEWRTAWSVPISMGTTYDMAVMSTNPTTGSASPTAATMLPYMASNSSFMAIGILLLAYFVIGGLDWIATLQDMAQSADQGDGLVGVTADAALYLVRHVLLYLGLSKFVLDWGGTTAMATAITTTAVDASSTPTFDDV